MVCKFNANIEKKTKKQNTYLSKRRNNTLDSSL